MGHKPLARQMEGELPRGTGACDRHGPGRIDDHEVANPKFYTLFVLSDGKPAGKMKDHTVVREAIKPHMPLRPLGRGNIALAIECREAAHTDLAKPAYEVFRFNAFEIVGAGRLNQGHPFIVIQAGGSDH